ncbi:MAG: hypothetical protein M3N22_02175 [Acidobacteriota bacterium]|nr:hypothetical protein [Acidobacteriota bacterium]
MRSKLAGLSLFVFLGAAICSAQDAPSAATGPNVPDYTSVNCSSFVSDNVPSETRLVSGENSNVKVVFTQGDLVYINRGRDKGVRVGDRFSVVRPSQDFVDVGWFKWQRKLMKAMGQAYVDAGELRVINVQQNASVAEVGFSCGYMQRGDIVRPYIERPVPQFKDSATFDRFAPVNGKRIAMVVSGADYTEMLGKNSVAFVNLGSNQSVKIGDYFRVFRYQGTLAETVPQTKGYQYKLFGFGSSPTRYEWSDLPRQVIGEGVVLNQGPNASTVMITYSSTPIYAGDYVELE